MKGSLLYEGKAKKVYTILGEDNQLILEYKDEVTAFNGVKKDYLPGKGRLINLISSILFAYCNQQGIHTHFIDSLSDTEQIVEHTRMIPLEVVVRNKATGSIQKRLGLEEGVAFKEPIVQLYYKEDALNDPFINEGEAKMLTGCTSEELHYIQAEAKKVNKVLLPLFQRIGLQLIDFKLEFGRRHDRTIIVADELSPDTCRLWEAGSNRKLDKDVFRQEIGSLLESYEEILTRLEAGAHV
ncbi:phosphoribosylaminoimidazole-succinocarboxamide synthase [Pontibacillus halophilus JSM 076056 = DSM 19796]|uniref:Phosphoribosylaminoimidazole-succinocarboxamide synthase n=1 Tax=Pontibacillus halophilus JSM 076056 = DSM 19796 TaxID=1385510 RepID=A0A0A5GG89_9BACI|nr:phosphoribosylaminoimidazolesuccinocarboxamide synthase [Pontibacillus halophilus]KGX90243.1 phosphoribosylaminoimidazole-succinocarboxamide synthase [Pontibacillus halophilus JSM 076056 = DSM 19796]